MPDRSHPIVARVDVLVPRPVSEVFATFVDLRTEPTYNADVHDVVKRTDGPIAQGTEFTGFHRGFGAVTWRLAELEADKHVAIEGAVGDGVYRWIGDFAPVGDGTRLTGAIEWQPARRWPLLRPLFAAVLRLRARSVFGRFARELGAQQKPGAKPDAVPLALFLLAAALLAADIIADLRDAAHVALELTVAVASLAGAVVLWSRFLRERAAIRAMRMALHASRADADKWREGARNAVEGLAAAIDAQFAAWQLTRAERELAFLLLKGLSLKEAAGVLGKSERTVRQQSLGIYRKGGLAGRAELSAFFLEDLLARAPP